MSPSLLFRRIAAAEIVTWALLLIGMFLKYVTKTTDLGVQVFGLVHGVVFLAYVLVTLTVWVDGRWPLRTAVVTLAAAVPPFLTIWAERRLEREGRLSRSWRLATGVPIGMSPPERIVAAALHRPRVATAAALLVVCVVTAVLITIGSPWAAQQV